MKRQVPWWSTWQALGAVAVIDLLGGAWFTFVDPFWPCQILFGFACGWMGVAAIEAYHESRRPDGGPTVL